MSTNALTTFLHVNHAAIQQIKKKVLKVTEKVQSSFSAWKRRNSFEKKALKKCVLIPHSHAENDFH